MAAQDAREAVKTERQLAFASLLRSYSEDGLGIADWKRLVRLAKILGRTRELSAAMDANWAAYQRKNEACYRMDEI